MDLVTDCCYQLEGYPWELSLQVWETLTLEDLFFRERGLDNNQKRTRNDLNFEVGELHPLTSIESEQWLSDFFVDSYQFTSPFWDRSRGNLKHSNIVSGIFLWPYVWLFPFSWCELVVICLSRPCLRKWSNTTQPLKWQQKVKKLDKENSTSLSLLTSPPPLSLCDIYMYLSKPFAVHRMWHKVSFWNWRKRSWLTRFMFSFFTLMLFPKRAELFIDS